MFNRKSKLIVCILAANSITIALICILFYSSSASSNFTQEERNLLAINYGITSQYSPHVENLSIVSYDEVKAIDLSYINDYSHITTLKSLVKKTPNLEKLYLNDNEHLTDSIGSIFDDTPNLRLLNISQTQITDRVVDKLNLLKKLENLYIGRKVVSSTIGETQIHFNDEFLEKLETPQIQKLTIRHECSISDAGILHLQKFSSLKMAVFYSSSISEQGILSLAEIIKDKKILRYSRMSTSITLRFYDVDGEIWDEDDLE